MVFRFLILSDEVNDFKREIKIDSDNTFLDLYKAIIESVGYSDKELASFFLCDNKWRKAQEITLVEMDTASDEDPHTMEDCILSDYLEDEKDKLIFEFDVLNERALFMELSEIIPGKNLKKPVITISEGEPPLQFKDFEETEIVSTIVDTDETFFGDENYDIEEIDKSGFEGFEDNSSDIEASDLL
ncbi:MAG: hypothetical protein WCR12_03985 [Dysgonamonadaceae bacterium]